MSDSADLAETLNRSCECMGTDVSAVRQQIESLNETHAHLVSALPVFIAREHARQIGMVIGAVERVAALPGYREEVLASAPFVARTAPRARGVFFGFDFHIAADGPKLIEINSNAGGAFVSLEILRAERACCTPPADFPHRAPDTASLENSIVGMFREEWFRSRGDRRTGTIAIVDDDPRGQYLYPEFLLARNLFRRHGFDAIIADARDLSIEGDGLSHDGTSIDLVYNRSTDFYLSADSHAALLEAHVRDLAVITPHPHSHALYSSKRNLVQLSDGAMLRAFGAADTDIETLLRAVPNTLRVAEPLERWWDERKQWFFKPAQGFASRGTYRGDKITRRVFGEITRGDYVAQRISPAGERSFDTPHGSSALKFDVRSYAYAGEQQFLAARLYQGQTTNLRTAGGGFAPVYLVDRTDSSTLAPDRLARCAATCS